MPSGVQHVLHTLQAAGFQAFLVGGCVRDHLRGVPPRDWDIATDAYPADLQRIFPGAKGVGAQFGTVLLPEQGDVEVTTFRTDLGYEDGRHPKAVEFGSSIEEDLIRRDFTVNAMAWDPRKRVVLDPTGGRHDLEEGLLRAVGDPSIRFQEDALRLLRMVRFSCRLQFDVHAETWEAAEGLGHLVARLSKERVRDEFLQILSEANPAPGLWMLHELAILTSIFPEFKGTERLRQGKQGAPTLLDHLMQAALYCEGDVFVRLACLLHDIGKTTTRRVTPEGKVTFHGHAAESSRLAEQALRRLRLDNASISRVSSLIHHHMSFGPVVEKTVRRWLAQYGEKWVRDLIALRLADYRASGGNQSPAGLEELAEVVSKLVQEEGAITRTDLAINGNDVMQHLGLNPGPDVGRVMQELYEFVLEDPQRNQREKLLHYAKSLSQSVHKKDVKN